MEQEGPPGQKAQASSWNQGAGGGLGGQQGACRQAEAPLPELGSHCPELKTRTPEPACSRPRVSPQGPMPPPALHPVRTPCGVRPGLGRDTACLLSGQTSAQWMRFASFSCLSNLTPFPYFIKLLLLLLPIILEVGRLASVTTEVCPSFCVLQIYFPLGFFLRPLVTMHFSQTFGCLLYIRICRSVPFAPTLEPRPSQEGPYFTPHKFSSSGKQQDPTWPAPESTFLPGGLGQDLQLDFYSLITGPMDLNHVLNNPVYPLIRNALLIIH